MQICASLFFLEPHTSATSPVQHLPNVYCVSLTLLEIFTIFAFIKQELTDLKKKKKKGANKTKQEEKKKAPIVFKL